MSTAQQRRTLSATTITVLQSLGTPPTHSRHGSLQLRVSSYSSSSSEESNDTVEVPEFLESEETLRFLGYDKSSARRIWDHYQTLVREFDPSPVCFFTIARAEIEDNESDAILDQDWDTALKNMGIQSRLRRDILDEEFKDLRCTQSAKYWVLETFEERIEFLLGLNSSIASKAVQAPARQTARPSSPSSHAHPSRPTSSRGESTSKSSPVGVVSPPSAESVPEEDKVVGPDEQIFYKGGSLDRLQAGKVGEQGLDMRKIRTPPPSDFCGSESGCYMTKQKELAWIYANYAKRRQSSRSIPIAIMYTIIKKVVLAPGLHIFGTDQLRRFFWAMRLEQRIPQDLKVYNDANILSGSCCQMSNDEMKDLQRAGGNHTMVRTGRLTGGDIATQIRFKGDDDFWDKMTENSRMWIETLPERGR
ncbi:MAG: hypothetical protein M1825_005862 [Sarcosagium campestre]|nr:MAG: hypothetical protein M1825_005862 [Sarcosagium campestre]